MMTLHNRRSLDDRLKYASCAMGSGSTLKPLAGAQRKRCKLDRWPTPLGDDGVPEVGNLLVHSRERLVGHG